MQKTKAILLLGALMMSGAASADLSTGLIAHYSFDDCTAADVSGNGHDGTISGVLGCVKGRLGQALQLNGTSDFIEVADTPELRLAGAGYTLSGWFFLNEYNSSYASALIAKRNAAATEEGYLWHLTALLQETPYGRPVILHSGGAAPGTSSAKATPLKSWQYIVVTYDASTQTGKLYVNNTLVGSSKNLPPPNPNTTAPLIIGRDNISMYHLNGILDDMRIYNRALTSSEITELYNAGSTVKGTIKSLGSHIVTCENKTTGQVVKISKTKTTTYDCEAKGLKVNAGEAISISIEGNAQ